MVLSYRYLLNLFENLENKTLGLQYFPDCVYILVILIQSQDAKCGKKWALFVGITVHTITFSFENKILKPINQKWHFKKWIFQHRDRERTKLHNTDWQRFIAGIIYHTITSFIQGIFWNENCWCHFIQYQNRQHFWYFSEHTAYSEYDLWGRNLYCFFWKHVITPRVEALSNLPYIL